MYSADTTIQRIQSQIKSKGFTQKQVFLKCGISEDTVKRMTDNKGISSFYLAKIADELDCSTDYLLGRTDYPDIYNQNDNSGNISNSSNGGFQISHTGGVNIGLSPEHDDITSQFLEEFKSLPYRDKLNVMCYVEDIKKNQQN